jgi:hypothetical protein
MKLGKFPTVCGLGLALAAQAGLAFAGEGKEQRTVVVQAESSVTLPNNAAQFNLGVMARGKKLDQLRIQTTLQANQIIAQIKKLGFPGLKIETTGFHTYPQYQQPGEQPQIVGYEVAQSIQVRLEESDQKQLADHVARVLEAGFAAGANQIHGLGFYVHDPEKSEQQALTQAVASARARAQAMAQAAGVRLGQILSLQSTGAPVMYEGYAMRAMMAPGMRAMKNQEALPNIEVGESQIRASVMLTYGIQ